MSRLENGSGHEIVVPGTDKPFNLERSYKKSRKIGDSEAGTLMSINVSLLHLHEDTYFPEALLDKIGSGKPDSENNRRALVSKLHANSPNPFELIGMPSSAFILWTKRNSERRHPNGGIYLDYLLEDPTYNRQETKTLHTVMVEYDNLEHSDRYHPNNLAFRQAMWSGHVANLTEPYVNQSYHSVFLYDKFARLSDVECALSKEKQVIEALHTNGFLPITGDGRIIDRNKTWYQ